MSEYRSNATAAEVAERLFNAKSTAILTHTKPDGDAIGSALALRSVLVERGAKADIYIAGPLEPGLKIIAGDTPLYLDKLPPNDQHDLQVILDTGAWSQLETYRQFLRERVDQTICIDHHSRGNGDVAAVRYIDENAASTTVVLLAILDAAGFELQGGPGSVAESLFLGLATDTGWFRHSNADAETFAIASRLLDLGIDKDRLYQITDQSYPVARLFLEARAMGSIELHRDGRVAIMSLRPEDFAEVGASVELLTGIVNLPSAVGQVRMSILLSQTEKGRTKISFRSKPPISDMGDQVFYDVNELASHFNGGGHIHAAGAKVDLPLPQAKQQLIEIIQQDVGLKRC